MVGKPEPRRSPNTADTIAETAYQLLARTHLAEENIGGARQAVDACRAALATLDLAPSGATVTLVGPSSVSSRGTVSR